MKPRKLAAGQTYEMYDTVDVSTVPSNPFAVAGYTSGYWPTYLPLIHAFPNAHAVSINISAYGLHGDCLDVEPGDADASQAATWVGADFLAGFQHPCVYTSISNLGNVEANLSSGGFHYGQYFTWCAWYRYTPGIVQGCDAVQWTDRALNSNLDESTVTAGFLSIAQPPLGPPPPPPNTMHYERYSQQQLTTPWGTSARQEYAWTYNYDWARPYYGKSQYFNHLVVNLQVKLRWWAGQLLYRINHSPASQNYSLWRYSREREALNRVKGKVCTPTYDTCNN